MIYLNDPFIAANGTQLTSHSPLKGGDWVMTNGSDPIELIIQDDMLRRPINGVGTAYFYNTLSLPEYGWRIDLRVQKSGTDGFELTLARNAPNFGNGDKYLILSQDGFYTANDNWIDLTGVFDNLNTTYRMSVHFTFDETYNIEYYFENVLLATESFSTPYYNPLLNPGFAIYDYLGLSVLGVLDVQISDIALDNFIEIPVQKLTADQYGAIGLKNTTSTFPFKFYDNEDYPQRTISVWPVPTLCHAVKLWLWQPLINAADLDTDIAFPQGYERALRFALAVELAAEFGKEVPQNVRNIAKMSKGTIKRLNSVPQILKGDLALSSNKSFNVITGDTIPNNS